MASTGLLATVLLAAAVLRPVRIASRATDVGPRVVLLIDRSLSMALPGDGATRKRTAANALRSLREAHREARFSRLGFGRGAASAWDGPDDDLPTDQFHSDLAAAIASISEAADEKLATSSSSRMDAWTNPSQEPRSNNCARPSAPSAYRSTPCRSLRKIRTTLRCATSGPLERLSRISRFASM